MTLQTNQPMRLLIGAGSYADAHGAVGLAELVADIVDGDLGGLFVEETVVTELVALPGQRVVTSSGTLVVAPSQQQVRTLLESDAVAFRDMLSGLARAKTRKWSFERRHGELISNLCKAANGWDILLLGYRETHRHAGRLVLIAPPEAAPQVSVDLATTLAEASKTGLLELCFGQDNWKRDLPGVQFENFETETAMLARLSRINASAVVLDLSAGPLRTEDQLRHLLAVARCPVLVLGASTGERSIAHTTQIPPASLVLETEPTQGIDES